MEMKEVNLSSITLNPDQPRKAFDKDKVRALADSIKEQGILQPVLVDKQNKLIAGEMRVRALKLNNSKNIPVIVRDSDKLSQKEMSLSENWHRQDLSSVDRENAVYDLWKSGKYKSEAELARKLGVSYRQLNDIIEAKEFRTKSVGTTNVSTSTIRETRGLPDYHRKKIIEQVEKGEISTRKVRDEARYIKQGIKAGVVTNKPELPPTKLDYVGEINNHINKMARLCEPLIVEQLTKSQAQYILMHYDTYIRPFVEALRKKVNG